MPAYFIGADPLNDAPLKAAFGHQLRQVWAGGWAYTTDESLDQVSKALVNLQLSSAVVFPFAAGHQLAGSDQSGMILNEVIEAANPS